jgi:hypothetical protein
LDTTILNFKTNSPTHRLLLPNWIRGVGIPLTGLTPSHFLCLSQSRTWISNVIYVVVYFMFSQF